MEVSDDELLIILKEIKKLTIKVIKSEEDILKIIENFSEKTPHLFTILLKTLIKITQKR